MSAVGRGAGAGKGLPARYARHCVLLVLTDGPSHGYELLEELRRQASMTADAGGLYRTLRALEHQGLVHSWWEMSASGPPRRTYELTDKGRDASRAALEELADLAAVLATLLRCHGDERTPVMAEDSEAELR